MDRFLSLDFETGGTDPKRNFPVSLGVALFDSGKMVDGKEWVIAPPSYKGKISREYDVNALSVSGLTWKQILEGNPSAKVVQGLHEFAQEHGASQLPILAYNAPFDLAFYSELLFAASSWNNHTKRMDLAAPPLYGPWQCVRMLAQRVLFAQETGLDAVSAKVGLTRTGTKHGALEDAILCAEVYLKIIGMDGTVGGAA